MKRIWGVYRRFFPEIFSSNYVDKHFLIFKKKRSQYKKNYKIFYNNFNNIINNETLKKIFTKEIIRKLLYKKKLITKIFFIKYQLVTLTLSNGCFFINFQLDLDISI